MTLGWIKEDAEERFFESRARTGLELTPRAGRECPFCDAWLANFFDLNIHLREHHTGVRPFLLLDGREPGGEDTVRWAPAVAGVVAIGADVIKVSVDHGAPRKIGVTKLHDLLSRCGRHSLEVRLENHGASGLVTAERYYLKVRIASGEELRRADEAFVRLFGRGEAHLLTIDRMKSEAGGGAPSEYVGALAEYVRGLLVKDQAPGSGVHGAPVDWTDAYKASLQVLTCTPRPLAYLICGLMRFALNDFSDWRRHTEFPLLDLAYATLGPLTEGVTPAAAKSRGTTRRGMTICPIDAGVDLITHANQRLARLRRWSLIEEEAARNLASSGPLGPLDRAKACALWALTASRLAGQARAEEPLRRLANNDCFGEWAEAQLASVSK